MLKLSEPHDNRSYTYDRVFSPSEGQQLLYDTAVKSVVLDSLNGFNGSIIAYGQTGTGKTHTMEGDEGEQRGVIPRASEEIFNYVEQTGTVDSKFLVRVSFLQIYNEQVCDLLDPDSLKKLTKDTKHYLAVRESGDGGVYVDGLTEHIVKSPAEIAKLLVEGSKMRTTASTKMSLLLFPSRLRPLSSLLLATPPILPQIFTLLLTASCTVLGIVSRHDLMRSSRSSWNALKRMNLEGRLSPLVSSTSSILPGLRE